MPVRHVNNGDGSVTQFDADTGQELVTFLDQDGSFTRDHLEPAAASAPAPEPRGADRGKLTLAAREAAPTQTVMPERSVVTPSPKLTPTEEAFQRHLAGKGVLETAGKSIPDEPAEAVAPAPLAAPKVAPRPNLPVAAVQQEGLSPESQKAAEESRLRVTAAGEEADEATTQAEQAELDAAATRIQGEAERRMGQAAADAEMSELAQRKMAEAQEFARQARAAPIQPGQALAGDKFFFAILANVGAGLTNFGAALLGQKAVADPNVVDDIIADSVRMQQEQKTLTVQGADQAAGDARADALRKEIQANASLEKWFEAQAAAEKVPEMRAAWSANAAQRAAAREEKTRQLAEAEWTREAVSRERPKPTETVIVNPETAEEMAVLKANNVKPEDLAKYGAERQKLGADPALKHIADARQIIRDLTEKGSTDVPGVGPIDDKTQALLRSNDASKVNQALGFVITTFVKNRSGAAVTDKERDYLQKIITGSGSNQREGIENGLRSVESEVRQQLNTLDSANSGAARAYSAIDGLRRGRQSLSDEQRARREEQLSGKKAEPEKAPVPETKSVGTSRSLENITGQDEVAYDAEQRRKKRERDAEREMRRTRLSRFLGP